MLAVKGNCLEVNIVALPVLANLSHVVVTVYKAHSDVSR